jgi:hypothetical protein
VISAERPVLHQDVHCLGDHEDPDRPLIELVKK